MKFPLINPTYEEQVQAELYAMDHTPIIFNRVIWQRTIGKPSSEYDTCHIFYKIQRSYLSKFFRYLKELL